VLAIFNSLGGGEVIAILIIGLIVLGPEKLPDAIKKFGNIYGEFRRMSQGFQSELRDAFDEPLQSLRGTAQMMQDSVNQPLQAITDMKAPVVGGAAAAEPVDVTATEVEDADVAADGVAAEGATEDASEVATVEEVQAPVDDDEAPAGSAAETWAAERAHGAAAAPANPAAAAAEPVTPAAAEVEVEAEPDVREDEEPVLAEAGLLLSEPEMPTESSEDEERPG
jgi:sec-independent protein translocase protein TatB